MNQPQTVDDIARKVRETVTEEKLEHLDAVARKMIAAENDATGFLRTIRSRKGMVFYLNTSAVGAANSIPTLFVRVHGINCGQVTWRERGERTFMPLNHTGAFSECGWEELAGGLPWADARVARYVAKAAQEAERHGYSSNEAGVQAGMVRSFWEDRQHWPNEVLVTYPATSRQSTRGVPYISSRCP